mgnify:CR=1 FL=1
MQEFPEYYTEYFIIGLWVGGKQGLCLIMIKGKCFFFFIVSRKTNWGNEQGIQISEK